MRIEEIRANSRTKKRPFKKAFIDHADKHGDYSLAHCEPPPPVTTRPTKKVRKSLNDDSTTRAPLFIANQGSSSTLGAPTRSVIPPLHQQQQQEQHKGLMLLALEEDEAYLNPLHVFVRKQIEVFTATAAELTEPAPGRKQPIRLNQVGLRCIHCRHLSTTNATSPKATKVKRAVCYPSTMDRIYHSVSDMKFDHFSHCKELPPDVRKTFETLKTESTRSNSKKEKKPKNSTNKKGQHFSSTAQYYRYAASRIGLSDSPGGIIYVPPNHTHSSQGLTISPKTGNAALPTPICLPHQPLQSLSTNSISLGHEQVQEQFRKHLIHQRNPPVANSVGSGSAPFSPIDISCLLAANNNNNNTATELDLKNLAAVMNSGMLQSLLMNAIVAGANAQKSIDAASKTAANQQQQHSHNGSSSQQHVQALSYHHQGNSASCFTTQTTNPETCFTPQPQEITRPLASPEDTTVLNPLHCFVRKHVELFEADQEDISAPAPGRKTRVTLGQVGIRCVHCAKQPKVPLKDRIKRSICYPPSIDGLYHSISNMKFDHFGICPHLPSEAQIELAVLKNSRTSGRRQSVGSNKSNGRRNSGLSNTNMAQFYRDSAIAKGLVNTDKGIRFGNSEESSRKSEELRSTTTSPTSTGTDAVKVPTTALPVRDAPLQFPTGMSALMLAAASHDTCI